MEKEGIKIKSIGGFNKGNSCRSPERMKIESRNDGMSLING